MRDPLASCWGPVDLVDDFVTVQRMIG